MASAVSTEHIGSRIKVLQYDFDPGTSDATDVGWVNMRDYTHVMMILFHSVGTGDITSFSLLSNSAADGTGTDATIKTHALGSQPDAVGDSIVVEASAEEITGTDADAVGVSAAIALATAGDEAVVTYIFFPKRAYTGLTTNVIS